MFIGAMVRHTELAPEGCTPEDVTTCLCSITCEDAANKLKPNGIDEFALSLLEAQAFIDMEVNLGQRKKILDAIQKHLSGDRKLVLVKKRGLKSLHKNRW